MAEEEFEIDIYGDASNEQNETKVDESDSNTYNGDGSHDARGDDNADYGDERTEEMGEGQNTDQHHSGAATRQGGGGGSGSGGGAPQQGVKRKEGSDDRPVDPGATNTLLISELNWWNTDDEIRGWVRQAACEDELKDITFSEHKVNGKCKGQAYVEFTSQQAATATKHRIDALANENSQPGQKKQTSIYASPTHNPFRTLPKDAPARQTKEGQSNRTSTGQGYNNDRGVNLGAGNFGGGGGGGGGGSSGGSGSGGGGFRGGRGGFNRGGGGMNQGGGFNRNFSGSNMNAFNNNNMGFSNPMGGGGGFGGGGFNRGGMMGGGGMRGGGPGGMRGGRGGGMNGVMGAMPMGNMPMGGMAPGMGGMGMMGAGMPGFQGMQPQFNPAFAWGGNQSNDWNQNPHGAKRPRGE